MQVVHEGLQGSGKSYEAVVEHIIPALARRRPVVAFVDGLDSEKLAALASALTPDKPLTAQEVDSLLTRINREDVPTFYERVPRNALIVLDELQNFWPQERKPLPAPLREFISEARHHGRDFVLLTQNFKDCHAFWRRRTQRKILFVKATAIGSEKRYTRTVAEATGEEKWTTTSTTFRTYDPKYFGSYASHVADDVSTENYQAKGASIFRGALFRYVLPAMALVAVFGVVNVWDFFHQKPKEGPIHAAARVAPPGAVAPVAASSPAQAKAPDLGENTDPLAYVFEKLRPRLAAYMRMGNRTEGVVDFYSSDHRKMSLTITQLVALGAWVGEVADMLLVRYKGHSYYVTAWPIDVVGKVAEPTQKVIGGQAPPGG